MKNLLIYLIIMSASLNSYASGFPYEIKKSALVKIILNSYTPIIPGITYNELIAGELEVDSPNYFKSLLNIISYKLREKRLQESEDLQFYFRDNENPEIEIEEFEFTFKSGENKYSINCILETAIIIRNFNPQYKYVVNPKECILVNNLGVTKKIDLGSLTFKSYYKFE